MILSPESCAFQLERERRSGGITLNTYSSVLSNIPNLIESALHVLYLVVLLIYL